MSRLMLNLKEYMYARVVDGRESDNNTVDVTITDIVFQQLDDLGLQDLESTGTISLNTTKIPHQEHSICS